MVSNFHIYHLKLNSAVERGVEKEKVERGQTVVYFSFHPLPFMKTHK